MKTLFIALIATLLAAVVSRVNRFPYLDFDSFDFDITWEDITDDLWP
ncbi:hypothetical protein [Spirosoma montaniterrae]|nr:hypothetical protein [Spirosoma montaniterrae]